jgi:hypothetical protein
MSPSKKKLLNIRKMPELKEFLRPEKSQNIDKKLE